MKKGDKEYKKWKGDDEQCKRKKVKMKNIKKKIIWNVKKEKKE
jgi:hypothetical protein